MISQIHSELRSDEILRGSSRTIIMFHVHSDWSMTRIFQPSQQLAINDLNHEQYPLEYSKKSILTTLQVDQRMLET